MKLEFKKRNFLLILSKKNRKNKRMKFILKKIQINNLMNLENNCLYINSNNKFLRLFNKIRLQY